MGPSGLFALIALELSVMMAITIGGIFDTAGFQSNIFKIVGDQDCDVADSEIGSRRK